MRFNKLDLNLLVALDAMLTERSISRAAPRVHLSQGAMSNALARLREYFDDELLVPVGRRMELTPRAVLLKDAVHDILARINTSLQVAPKFEPATEARTFRIVASDYSLAVFVPHLLRAVQAEAPSIRFEFLPQAGDAAAAVERGEADLLVIPRPFASDKHPAKLLFTDSYCCLMDQRHPLAGQPMTLDRFLAYGHVVMKPAIAGTESMDSGFMRRLGVDRRVEVTTFAFASIPRLLVGTDRLALLHRRLVQEAIRTLPLVASDPAFELPGFEQAMQWHKHRASDAGLLWLLETMSRVARTMGAPGSAPAGTGVQVAGPARAS